jgi:hypothetical protein
MARMRVCAQPGCPEVQAAPRCPDHARQAEQARGTRQQRGYTAEHDRLRARWKPKVDRCTVHCHARVCVEPARLILPGQAWDLGHTEDRTAWTGPEHATCNRSAGGRAAHGG